MAIRSESAIEGSRFVGIGTAGARFRAAAAASRTGPSLAAGGVESVGWATVCVRLASPRSRKVFARAVLVLTAGLRNLPGCAAGLAAGGGAALSVWAAAGSASSRGMSTAPTIRMGTPVRPAFPPGNNLTDCRESANADNHLLGGQTQHCKAFAFTDMTA